MSCYSFVRPRRFSLSRRGLCRAASGYLILAFLCCVWARPASSAVRISEILAENDGGLRDVDGATPDWIEIHNDSALPVNLAGWHLTDTSTNLTRWTFPATNLAAGAYLVVFASGKDRAIAGAELHTSFELDELGEYLALVHPDGTTIATEFSPLFPAQRANVSFGSGRDVTTSSLLELGAVARVMVPANAGLGLDWTARDFNDASWFTSNAPVGFTTGLIATPVLSVDFNERAIDEIGNTQPGFSSFVINSNGSSGTIQAIPSTRIFSGISVTVSNTAPLGYDDRARTTPVNSGAFTESLLLRDFIFSREVSGTGGLDVTIAGLVPNRPYQMTVWSFDSGSLGKRMSDWFANGVPVTNGYSFDGGVLPTSNERYRFTFEASADRGGVILLSGRRNPGSTNQAGVAELGVFLNAFQLSSLTATSPDTGLASLMVSNNASAYLRLPFQVGDPSAISSLRLRMRYDDGFVAYVNGQVVAARNAPATPTWNSTATGSHHPGLVEEIEIVPPPGLLVAGANVLAIHGLNVHPNDPDFLIAPELLALQAVDLGPRFFTPPTPGSGNIGGYLGLVADTKFSVNRGFYESPFALSLTCATPGAQIRYTTNGSPPSLTNGFVFGSPINITRQSFIRAAAFFPGYVPSDIDTHSYIFLRDVLRQSNNLAGYPTSWQGSYPADYAMDTTIVNHGFYGTTLSNDLRSIPVLSIVTEHDGLWGPVRGIYNHATSTHDLEAGQDWERAASAELILPEGANGTTAFAVNCAIRMHGNASRDNARTPKHNIRLRFDSDFGSTKLRYDWFSGGVEEFDNIILRADGFVDAWPSRYSDTTAYFDAITGISWLGQRYRPETATYLRDVFAKNSQQDMGWVGSRSGWVHLYLNGIYWGLYNPMERLDSSFMAEHLGGWDSDWDVIVGPDTGSTAVVADGSNNDWNALMSLLAAGVTSEAAYQSVSELVDVDNVIDYFLLHFFIEAEDWPHHNWYASHRRANLTNGLPATKWQIFTWDQEVSLDRNVRRNRTGVNNPDTPAYIYSQLRAWPEFRVRFGDRVQKHLFNGGALTPSNNVARFAGLAAAITNAINGESARWGDAREFTVGSNPGTGVTFTRDEWWVPELQKLWTNFFPTLTADNVARLRAVSLYPNVGAPSFNQFGGSVSNGFGLVMTHTNANGVIYYTTDGADPRVYGSGAVAPGAAGYSAAITFNAPTLVRARVLNGAQWSALVETVFYPPQDFSKFALTEIMFNPLPAGTVDGDEFEFVEMKNTGTNSLNLGGLRINGIGYDFPIDATLAPGQFWLLARNATAFASRYPGVSVHGIYYGRLANEGETLTVVLPGEGKLFSVDYRDEAPWPLAADGHGFSLVPRTSNPIGSSDNGADWRPSTNPGGSPGADDPSPVVPPVVINEIRVSSVGAGMVELLNLTSAEVNLGGWFLTDDPGVPMKYRIPNATVIQGNSVTLIPENLFNPTPGTNGSFGLSSGGGEIYLFSGDANTNLTGYSHGFKFGATLDGFSFIRYVNSVGEEQFPRGYMPLLGNVANAAPLFGPIVISEIHYNPSAGGDEFIELHNFFPMAHPLYSLVYPTNTARLAGLDYKFPTNIVIEANGYLLLVATNPAAFRAKYDVPSNVPILGPFAGKLQGSGERLVLESPDIATAGGILYVTVDEVRYNDRAPWPPAADGSGPSLQRRVLGDYGNDPINWDAAGPTPGRGLETADTDGDGVPDGWEIEHSTDRYIADGDADPDGDGATNLEEFRAGTHPQVAASRLELQVVALSAGATTLEFLAVSNRTYTVLYKNSLEAPVWSKLQDIESSPMNRVVALDDESPVQTNRFYRLVTPRIP